MKTIYDKSDFLNLLKEGKGTLDNVDVICSIELNLDILDITDFAFNEVNFGHLIIQGSSYKSISFTRCGFTPEIRLSDCVLSKLLISACYVNSGIEFFNCTINDFESFNTEFYAISAYNSSFKNYTVEVHNKTRNINFRGTSLGQLDISTLTMFLPEKHTLNVSFDLCEITDVLEIQDTFTISKLEFINTNLKGPTYLVGCDFEFLYFSGLRIDTYLSLQNTHTQRLKINGLYGHGAVWLKGFETFKTERETARLIKHLAYQDHSIITALKFKKIELEQFDCELSRLGWRHLHERLLLAMNRMSNNYGLSWVRGIGFTLLMAVLFFEILCVFGFLNSPFFDLYKNAPDNYSGVVINWLLEGFTDVLNIFNFKDTVGGITLSGAGQLIYFASKVMVSYGIYQTVSAFRKYGK